MIHKSAMIVSTALLATLLAAPSALAVNNATNATAKPAAELAQLFGDPVVAKGEGVEVKRSQLDSVMITIKSAAAARGQAVSPEQTRLLERQVLQRLIQIQLLLKKANAAEKAKGNEVASNRLELVIKRAGSDEAFSRQLKSVGMTQEELRTKMADEAAAEAVAVREIKINISEDAVKKFYEENPARFEDPEMVRASHILLGISDPTTHEPLSAEKKAAKRKQAEDLLKRARAGEDFAKLAREFSDDPGSKDKGGEYTFPRGMMDPAFESAAFSLTTNQISDIVTTQFGYHIIKLSEKLPAHKVELATVAERLKEGLKQQELEKQLPAFIAKLIKEAKVEILDEKLKPEPDAAGGNLETVKPNKADEKK